MDPPPFSPNQPLLPDFPISPKGKTTDTLESLMRFYESFSLTASNLGAKSPTRSFNLFPLLISFFSPSFPFIETVTPQAPYWMTPTIKTKTGSNNNSIVSKYMKQNK